MKSKNPKTSHEEIMFCIESTNDIVSKILELMEQTISSRSRLLENLKDVLRK